MQKSEALVGTSTNDDRRHRRRDDGRIASGGGGAHNERREGATTDAGGRASIAAAAEEEERRRPPPPPPPPPAGGADGDVVVVGGDSVISGGVDSSTSSSGIISSPAVVATGMPLLPPSSSSSAYDDDPHHRRRHRPRPFFYYRNDTAASSDASRSSSHPRYFSLHPHRDYGSATPYHYDYYGTTLSIIFLLHLVYFHQWNARRARRDVCTSYDQLVGRKQYYRAVLAFASHPPSVAAEGEGGASEFVGDAASSGDDYSAPSEGTRSSPSSSSASSSPGPRGRLLCGMIPPAAFFRATLPLRGRGSLSGLPLLAYASHVLWQCRALEELYDSYDGSIVLGVTGGDAGGGSSGPAPLAGIGTSQIAVEDLDLLLPRRAGDVYDDDDGHHRPPSWSEGGCSSYLRVLSALALTSLLLELSLIRYVLRRVDGIANFDGYRTTPRQLLSHRAMCSIASLSTAVLGVYDSHFPYTPPPVLPFVGNVPFLPSSSSGGFVSRLLSMLLLMGLSRGIHPITSVVSGMWSGYLWSWGLTSFLGTRYWGNVTLLVSAMAILLSLKAQPSHSACMKLLFPCIDYVGWDEVGDIIVNDGRGGGTTPRRRNGNDGDLEDGGGHHPGEEGAIPPLLSSSRSSLSDRGIRSAIRGRVPRMDSNDSDDFLDGAEDLVVNNEETMPLAAPSRFGALHSRRGSGIQSD